MNGSLFDALAFCLMLVGLGALLRLGSLLVDSTVEDIKGLSDYFKNRKS